MSKPTCADTENSELPAYTLTRLHTRGQECEDYCTARTLHAAENRATLTRIAVNLLNRYARKHKCGTKKARMMANQSPEALEEMLAA